MDHSVKSSEEWNTMKGVKKAISLFFFFSRQPHELGSSILPVTSEQFLVSLQHFFFFLGRKCLTQSEWDCVCLSTVRSQRQGWSGWSKPSCLPTKGQTAQGVEKKKKERNFTGVTFVWKMTFLRKREGFLEECPRWKEPSWQMDCARLPSGVLSHEWKIRPRLLGQRYWKPGATWNVDFCIHTPLGVFASV